MNIKILISTHKPYKMPNDPVYLPIHAGHKGKQDIGYQGDDRGDNISDKNWYYCELTAIYWAWKNLEAEAIGVVHYRRHFTTKSWITYHLFGKWNSILTRQQAQALLEKNDIIVAKRRWYLVESNKSHYSNGHNPQELVVMRRIISERCPDYQVAFDQMNKRRWAHMFNMFIMKRDKFNDFCSWWFDLLFEFEKQIDITGYISSEKRAFIGERLLDVWLIKNQYPYKEVNVIFMEKQNWIKKILLVFLRKFITHQNN